MMKQKKLLKNLKVIKLHTKKIIMQSLVYQEMRVLDYPQVIG